MQKTTIIIVSLLIAACSSPTKNEEVVTTVPTPSASNTVAPVSNTINYKDSLLGNWSDGSDENATIHVMDDSILYVSHMDKYKYMVQNDSLKLYFTNETAVVKMSLKGDTMFWFSKTDTTKLWRFN